MAKPLAYDPEYALNAICPYYTMFPLEYPLHVLKTKAKTKSIVLDPFCGRGTTIFAARHLGHLPWGIDTSPIAVAIARAKLATATTEEVIQLAENLIQIEPKHIPTTTFFRVAFHKDTLRELCALREGLLRIKYDTSASVILRAAALGCLHGPLNKTKDLSYFSNQMPRTFSAKPDYAVRYWKEHNLKAPRVKVIDVLARKLKRIVNLNAPCDSSHNQVICSDSRSPATYNVIPKHFSTVITSPPYYGMRTYVQDQWLRLWLLGGGETVDYTVKDQLDHNGQDTFIKSLASVWSNIYSSKSDALDLFIRFGSIPSAHCDPRKILRSSFEESSGWKVLYTKNALTAESGKRQANQMGDDSAATNEYDFHVVRR